jgi:hypothetical protein
MKPSRVIASVFACAALAASRAIAQSTQATIPVITSDLANFYRAMDLAEGTDSATRVHIFRDEYLRKGSPGLKDWALLRLTDFDGVLKPWLTATGWSMDRAIAAYLAPSTTADQTTLRAALDTLVPPRAAVTMAAFTAKRPRFFAEIRARMLALDTSTAFKAAAQSGLARAQALYPAASIKPVYIVVGQLTSGGTVGASGMLLGAEMGTKAATTPIDELVGAERTMIAERTLDAWVLLIVHEAVHTFQPRSTASTLLHDALREGVPDFIASLAVPGGVVEGSVYQRYGRAHEAQVWREFARGMRTKESTGNWLYSYNNPRNHGAPDLGYFVGFRIAEAYYARASDKAAAINDLIQLRSPTAILRASRYGTQWTRR